MELHITPDIEQALVEQAWRRGTMPEQLALESSRQQFVYPAEASSTLADYLAASIGVLHSDEHVVGGARVSEGTGGSFTQALIEKRKQGHL
jgi:hypothetical protein